jgi:hypothetical protein
MPATFLDLPMPPPRSATSPADFIPEVWPNKCSIVNLVNNLPQSSSTTRILAVDCVDLCTRNARSLPRVQQYVLPPVAGNFPLLGVAVVRWHGALELGAAVFVPQAEKLLNLGVVFGERADTLSSHGFDTSF